MIVDNFVIKTGTSTREALRKLDQLSMSGSVLFVVDQKNRILGSLTDGDIRRGLLKDLDIDDFVDSYMQPQFHFLIDGNYTKSDIKTLKSLGIRFAPSVEADKTMVRILEINAIKSVLPLDAAIMAGGKGERLMPLTADTPKPMLKVGGKPIIEINIDRLIRYGVQNINISLGYLGSKITDFFGDGKNKGANINYVTENSPLGTMGALSLMDNFCHDHILVMNSDLLTNIDFESLFEKLILEDADMIVATTPYHIRIPFAIFELENENLVKNFREKPQFTYQSNAGIYIFKRELLKYIPKNSRFDATDLMKVVIDEKLKLISEPILGYWLDIGSMEDFKRAQEDIKHINLNE